MALASKTGEVRFVRKGEKGDLGPIIYPAGNYSQYETYKRSKQAAPFVEQEGEFYVMAREGEWYGYGMGRTPKDDVAQNKGWWIHMDKYVAIIAQAVFAQFAKLGDAIFYGQYMFSQHGVDRNGQATDRYQDFSPSYVGSPYASFTPNILIDWLNGMITSLNAKIKGEIEAESGKIGKFAITNGFLEFVSNNSADEYSALKIKIGNKEIAFGSSLLSSLLGGESDLIALLKNEESNSIPGGQFDGNVEGNKNICLRLRSKNCDFPVALDAVGHNRMVGGLSVVTDMPKAATSTSGINWNSLRYKDVLVVDPPTGGVNLYLPDKATLNTIYCEAADEYNTPSGKQLGYASVVKFTLMIKYTYGTLNKVWIHGNSDFKLIGPNGKEMNPKNDANGVFIANSGMICTVYFYYQYYYITTNVGI